MNKPIGKSILNFLKSMKLAIILFIIIAISSLVGTFLIQGASHEIYIQKYGTFFGKLIIGLRLNNLYHSIWYNLLLLFLVVNTAVCTISRLKGIIKIVFDKSFKDKETIERLPGSKNFIVDKDRDSIIQTIKSILKKRLFSVQIEKGKKSQIFAAKGGISKFGSTVIHISVIIILLGGAIGGYKGYRIKKGMDTEMEIPIPERAFKIKLNWFKIEYNKEGKVKQYTSSISVIENGKTKFTKTIMVNHPLSYEGINIYQSGYDKEPRKIEKVHFILTDKRENKEIPFTANFKQKTHIQEIDSMFVIVSDFVCDFVMDNNRQVTSRSDKPKNPAVYVSLLRGDSIISSEWIFLKFPGIHKKRDERYSLQFIDYTPSYYTILEIAKNPGIPIIYIGFLLMSIGLFLNFYIFHRRYWIELDDVKEGTEISIGGIADRNKLDFKREIDMIMQEIKKRHWALGIRRRKRW